MLIIRSFVPDAMKDDGQLSGKGDLGLLQALTLCDAHGPGLQGGPFDDAAHHDVCRLVEGTSDPLVADLADAASAIKLTGLVLARGQAQMGADSFGSEELAGTSMPVRYVRATSAPTPGTLVSRRQTGSRCTALTIMR